MPKPGAIVLYIEDEEFDRFLMQRCFTRAGLGNWLRIVNDGKSAIDYLAGHGVFADRENHPLPALVLLDLNLPEVHGFEVLKWIRQQPAYGQLPVVVFSSSAVDADEVRARNLGANDFIKKPGSTLGFSEIVQQLNAQWLPEEPDGQPSSTSAS